jgi:hypothetical protein
MCVRCVCVHARACVSWQPVQARHIVTHFAVKFVAAVRMVAGLDALVATACSVRETA